MSLARTTPTRSRRWSILPLLSVGQIDCPRRWHSWSLCWPPCGVYSRPTHPGLATTLQDMVELCILTGRNDEAANLRAELAILPSAKPPATPVASDIKPPGPGKKDLKSREESLDAARNSKGQEAAETITAMTELAAAYGVDGSGRKAVKLGEDALAVARRVLPSNAPQTTAAMKVLIVVYRSLDLEADAAKLEMEMHALGVPTVKP
jgi:hypothetical protein